ncbi:hypothetical protein [Aquisphaera insulae]|uniref:hypothetical protein n=1 Tax=Aquisphaera insulae TaxID=2712864 RepID=UPI0013EA3AA1|nr:hypothetical protein [Aquisphaera insulae]
MRTIHDVRTRHLDTLRQAVQRPGLFGGTDLGVELVMQGLLRDLCFIDEREGELQAAMDGLVARGQFNSMAVRGSFLQHVDNRGTYADEVASVYAAVAHRLGYLAVDATLPDADFRRLLLALHAGCRDRDWTAAEVVTRFGRPGLRIGWVFAYVPTAGPDWVYFDFDACSAATQDGDSLLRNVRTPAEHFARELTFTPHGRRVCRVTVQSALGRSAGQGPK